MNEPHPLDLLLKEARGAIDAAAKASDTMKRASDHIDWLTAELKRVRARTAYPEFCKHPERCCNMGKCMAEWVCND